MFGSLDSENRSAKPNTFKFDEQITAMEMRWSTLKYSRCREHE